LKRNMESDRIKVKTSPPMRGRGLKPLTVGVSMLETPSPPMRGRGLKLKEMLSTTTACIVAPHAGAWIETPPPNDQNRKSLSRPPCGGVD